MGAMMGRVLTVEVPGVPVAKGRPRVTRTGHAYTPTKTRDYERLVAGLVRHAMGNSAPLDGPLRLDLVAVFPRPRRLMARRHPDGRIAHTVKPDADNLIKSIVDGAEKGGAILNDSRICRLVVEKWHAARGEEPGVWMRLAELGGAL